MNVFKHKLIYIQLTFNQNQFYQTQFLLLQNQTHSDMLVSGWNDFLQMSWNVGQ